MAKGDDGKVKISVGKPIYPGHTGRTWRDVAKVFLDGKQIDNVVMVDTDRGIVERYITRDGRPIIFGKALGREYLKGEVMVEWE